MRRALTLIALFCISVGCVRLKTQEEISLSPSTDAEFIHETCSLIDQTGDIFALLEEIRLNTKKMLSYLGTKDPGIWMEEINSLASGIKSNSNLVTRLAQDEWNSPVVDHTIRWNISAAEISKRPGSASILSGEVIGVFLQGIERPDLAAFAAIHTVGTEAHITYQQLGTMLEYCQLNQTLMVLTRLEYKGWFGARTKYFNLYVKLESP